MGSHSVYNSYKTLTNPSIFALANVHFAIKSQKVRCRCCVLVLLYRYNETIKEVCPTTGVHFYPRKACTVEVDSFSDCEKHCTDNSWPDHCGSSLDCKFFQFLKSEDFSTSGKGTCLLSTANCEYLEGRALFKGVYIKVFINLNQEKFDGIFDDSTGSSDPNQGSKFLFFFLNNMQ